MQKSAEKYGLDDFIEEMTKVVEQNDQDADRVTKAEVLVEKLIRDTSWLPNGKLEPDAGHYARHSLYLDPQDRFEILALIWKPGQGTPVHDHDGTWGVEGVVSGRMKVTNYLEVSDISDNIVKLRNAGTMSINEQSTGQLLPPADCHVLEAVGEKNVITIHVYGKQLKHYKLFAPLDEEEMYEITDHYVGYTQE